MYPQFKKVGEEDDQNGNNSAASRGNWWQGTHIDIYTLYTEISQLHTGLVN